MVYNKLEDAKIVEAKNYNDLNWIECPKCDYDEFGEVGIKTETGDIVGTCLGCRLEVRLTP